MFRLYATPCALLACGLTVWAANYFFPLASESLVHQNEEPRIVSEEEGDLVVDNAEQLLGKMSLGEHSVTFRVTNRSSAWAEVLGFPGGCGPSCCLEPEHSGRMPIQPLGAIEVVCMLNVRRSGPFEIKGDLYVSDRSLLRTLHYRVTGVGFP